MTIQTQFHNWQDQPLMPDPRRCSPLLVTWRNYLLATWGGQDLGCYGQRSVVGGSSPSSHGSGAAQDWRYESPGPGRPFMLGTILPWLIDNSLELGLQAIHDYVGCRIWRPPGTSGRPAQPSPESGWRQQTPGSQMGQSWALWLHLECLNTRWSDTRSVEEMLRSRPDPAPTPTPDPDPTEDTDMLALDFGTPPDQPDPDPWWTRLSWQGDTLMHVVSPADQLQSRGKVSCVPINETELNALLDNVMTIGDSPFGPDGQAPNQALDVKWAQARGRT